MKYPALPARQLLKKTVSVFRGCSRSLRTGQGEFADMRNLSSDHYPVMGPRKRRGIRQDAEKASGLLSKDALCWVEGSEFVMNGIRVDMGLSEGDKQLVSMGAYVIIFPDKMWINTLDLTRFGRLEASFSSDTDVTFRLCTAAGADYEEPEVSETEPEKPKNGQLWLEPGGSLSRYSEAAGWVSIPSVYVKISAPGIGKPFSLHDGIELSGIRVAELNGSAVIWAKEEDWIVVQGLIPGQRTQLASEGAVTVTRWVPEMDYVVEAGNRLWGCRYGLSRDGRIVNELYASRLGDFQNWNCFMGTSTDSWAASVGSDGPFTGAVNHLGCPLFFKENGLHKIYISHSGAHGVQETACRGVQQGCGNTLAIVGDVLYYKSRDCVCGYDGSLPEAVSQELGQLPCLRAAAGSVGDKYYISMEAASGEKQLWVYDTHRKLWHREDGFYAKAFCACRGELYAIEEGSGRIYAMLGSESPAEKTVSWMAETGDLEITSPQSRYVFRLNLSMFLAMGANVRISARYDSESHFIPLCSIRGTGLRRITVPIRPHRCSHMRLRLEGEGMALLYAITAVAEKGSEHP